MKQLDEPTLCAIAKEADNRLLLSSDPITDIESLNQFFDLISDARALLEKAIVTAESLPDWYRRGSEKGLADIVIGLQGTEAIKPVRPILMNGLGRMPSVGVVPKNVAAQYLMAEFKAMTGVDAKASWSDHQDDYYNDFSSFVRQVCDYSETLNHRMVMNAVRRIRRTTGKTQD